MRAALLQRMLLCQKVDEDGCIDEWLGNSGRKAVLVPSLCEGVFVLYKVKQLNKKTESFQLQNNCCLLMKAFFMQVGGMDYCPSGRDGGNLMQCR